MSSDPLPERTFTWGDLERWADEGLIARSQLAAIREREATGRDGSSRPAAATPLREERHGFNLITIVYYVGAFLILFAYTVFMGLQWESLSAAGQVAVSLFSALGLIAVGAGVRRAGYPTGGGLLAFAGTGIVPLVVYSIQNLTGAWPEAGVNFDYEDFFDVISSAWVAMEVITIVVTLVVLWWIRFPLLMLLISFWFWFLSLDVSRGVVGDEDFNWGDTEQGVSILFAVVALGAGDFLQLRGARPYSFWLYLFGHLILLTSLGSWALDEDQRAIRGLGFLLVYVVAVVASVRLQSRVFLVFGAIGVYCYLGYLAFEVFEDTLGFTFSLAFIGLLLIAGAIAFQRFLQPWWARRATRHVPAT